MGSELKLATVRGISIGIHPTWLLAFAFIAWMLGTQFFPDSFSGWSTAEYWMASVATTLVLFASVLVHELAHSLVALGRGLPVHGITLFIFGGVSRIGAEAKRPRDEFLIAFAGPASSLLIGAVLLLLWTEAGPEHFRRASPIEGMIFYVGWMNVVLGVFNMLPGYPLDGGRMLRAAVWGFTGNPARATAVAGMAGRVVAWGLIGLGIFRVFRGDVVGGLWMAFIGVFLNSAANAARREARASDSSGAVTVRDGLVPTPRVVDAATPLSEVIRNVFADGRQPVVPVTDRGALIGFLSATDLARIDVAEWPMTRAADAVRKEAIHIVGLVDDAGKVLSMMQRHRLSHAPVVAGGRLVGVVTPESLARAPNQRSATDDQDPADEFAP